MAQTGRTSALAAWALVGILGIGLQLVVVAPVAAQAPPVPEIAEDDGYVEMGDGVGLRYTVVLPEGVDGPVPMVLQYSGYNPGSDAFDRSFTTFGPMLLERGIGIIGVSLRGTGCSEGQWVPFDPQWALDGVEVVDWIAEQEFSDGTVAMLGTSFPALVALATAQERPESLRAIAPSVPLADLYRDVVYPGGIYNTTFANAWTAIQKYGTPYALEEIAEGDARCAAAVAGQNDPEEITAIRGKTSPYVDSLARYDAFMTRESLARIDVPTLWQTAWQDEQLGSRPVYGFEALDPERSWLVVNNGTHGGLVSNAWFAEYTIDFLEHFLRGGAVDGFDDDHLHVLQEVDDAQVEADRDSYAAWPVATTPTRLFAQPDGSLGVEPAAEPATVDYAYPLPAPSWFVGFTPPNVSDDQYRLPVPPGGSAAFTTPTLAEDVELLGPGSLDLVVSSTASNVDVQVSLYEVRPDGQEQFVQRGWLRSTHRELVPELSTVLRPYQPHTSTALEDLPGEPTTMRVEIWPVGHVFRAGSALRVAVEAPLGFTGFRQLELDPTPQQVSVHVGGEDATSVVLPLVATEGAPGGLPACGTIANQPCRANPTPAPDGELTLRAADQPGGDGAPDPSSDPDGAPSDPSAPGTPELAAPVSPAPAAAPPTTAAAPTGSSGSLPATGGGAALAALALALTATRHRRA